LWSAAEARGAQPTGSRTKQKSTPGKTATFSFALLSLDCCLPTTAESYRSGQHFILASSRTVRAIL
jgi:hypothetical protein